MGGRKTIVKSLKIHWSLPVVDTEPLPLNIPCVVCIGVTLTRIRQYRNLAQSKGVDGMTGMPPNHCILPAWVNKTINVNTEQHILVHIPNNTNKQPRLRI